MKLKWEENKRIITKEQLDYILEEVWKIQTREKFMEFRNKLLQEQEDGKGN